MPCRPLPYPVRLLRLEQVTPEAEAVSAGAGDTHGSPAFRGRSRLLIGEREHFALDGERGELDE